MYIYSGLSFAKARVTKTMNKKCQRDGQTVADDVHELLQDSAGFQGTVRSGSLSPCPMSEGYFPGLINKAAGKSRVDISSLFSFLIFPFV